MKYCSIDIETTGLSECCQVIEVGAVINDLKEPRRCETFHRYLRYQQFIGEPYACAMHQDIFKIIADDRSDEIINPEELGPQMLQWFQEHGMSGKVVVAGKNFAGFDRPRLEKIPGFSEHVTFHHRVIDPAMLYMTKEDNVPPSLEECKKRAGLKGMVSHTALSDAMDVVMLVRNKFS